MDIQGLKELARYQCWADAQHWNTLDANSALLEDPEIKQRLNHMVMATEALQALARGEAVDATRRKERDIAELRSAMSQATSTLETTIESVDGTRMVQMPRGPNDPFSAPAGVLLLQALMHSQHHRGQNASRMRALGVTPPMTDFVIWHAMGRP